MPRVTVQFKDKKVRAALRRLERTMPGVAQRAVNRTLPKVRTTASQEVRELRNLPASFVKRQIKVLKASRRARITAKIYSYTTAPPVERFKGTRMVRARGRARRGQQRQTLGVQLEVIPGQRHVLANAYITPSGQVYDRGRSGAQRPRRLFGPSVATAMRKPEVSRAMQRRASVEFPREIDAQLRRQIARAGLKGRGR